MKKFFFSSKLADPFGAHSVCYSTVTGGYFLGNKAIGA